MSTHVPDPQPGVVNYCLHIQYANEGWDIIPFSTMDEANNYLLLAEDNGWLNDAIEIYVDKVVLRVRYRSPLCQTTGQVSREEHMREWFAMEDAHHG